MSGYWDENAREIKANFEHINAIETKIIATVQLVTGDKEFPEAMRQRILNAIHMWRYHNPIVPEYNPTEGHRMSEMTRRSRLVDELHSLFHDLAGLAVQTRFGQLSDDPDDILNRRNEYVKENFGE